MNKNKRSLIVIVFLAGVLTYVSLRIEDVSMKLKYLDFQEDVSVFNCIKKGMSYNEVESCLGKPSEIIEAGTKDYYVKGYAKKEKEVLNRAYVYVISFAVCYVYFDVNGVVDDFFIGGS